jgi:hypothetical protein
MPHQTDAYSADGHGRFLVAAASDRRTIISTRVPPNRGRFAQQLRDHIHNRHRLNHANPTVQEPIRKCGAARCRHYPHNRIRFFRDHSLTTNWSFGIGPFVEPQSRYESNPCDG